MLVDEDQAVGFQNHLVDNIGCNSILNLKVTGSHDDILKNEEFFKTVGEFTASLALTKPKRASVKREKKVVPEKAVIPMEDMVDIYLPVSTRLKGVLFSSIFMEGIYCLCAYLQLVLGDVVIKVKA